MKVGSVVFCIDDDFTDKQKSKITNLPKKGKYYLVRNIRSFPHGNIGIILEELNNSITHSRTLREQSFSADRFWEVEIPKSHLKLVENLINPNPIQYLDMDDLLSEED